MDKLYLYQHTNKTECHLPMQNSDEHSCNAKQIIVRIFKVILITQAPFHKQF